MKEDWLDFVSVFPVFEAAGTFDYKQGSTMRASLGGAPDFVFGSDVDVERSVDELIAFVLSFLFWKVGSDTFATRWAEFNEERCFLMWRWARRIPRCRVLKATSGIANRDLIIERWTSSLAEDC